MPKLDQRKFFIYETTDKSIIEVKSLDSYLALAPAKQAVNSGEHGFGNALNTLKWLQSDHKAEIISPEHFVQVLLTKKSEISI
jgi:hypothetical protein